MIRARRLHTQVTRSRRPGAGISRAGIQGSSGLPHGTLADACGNLDLMDDQESLPPVRFRAIIEMSFPDADRYDPTDYERLMEQWRKALENSAVFNCKDVVIREFLTIGGPEDGDYSKEYVKWRHQDLSHVRPGIRITGSDRQS